MGAVGLSAKCQKRTHAPQQTASLFDYLVGTGEQRGRHGEAKGLRRLEVDHKLELGRLHHRQLGWLGTLQDAAGIDACLSISVGNTASVTHQTPNCSEFRSEERRVGKKGRSRW